MKKVLSLVLVLTLVLGSFSFAFGAAPNDVVGTEYEEAVSRLEQLGVLTGYPDGTFKPANTITRAEFAAAVVRVKGLEAAAKASVGGTAFKDVPAGNWAAGYVNIATKAGLVKGMGDGTFAPSAPVTYEQAVTMVMRALNYEATAEARGGYPYGYLIVANENGLLDAVKGTQGAPALRGLVAQLLDNALEIPMMIQVGVGFNSQPLWVKSGTQNTDEVNLLDDLGFTNIVGRVVKVDEAKERITVKNDKVTKTLDVKEGFDFEAVEGLRVKVWYTSDEAALTKVLDEPKFDAVEPADTKVKLIGENKKYSLAKDATLVVNGEEVELKDFTADYAKVVFDKDGDIVWAKGYKFNNNIVVEKVNGNVVESFGYDEVSLKDYTIVKDGKTISIDDLEKNDIVFYNKGEEFAVVYNKGIEGKIGKIYTDSFGFEGKTYTTQGSKFGGRYLSANKIGTLTDEILTEIKDSEKTVTVFLDYANKVVLVVGDRDIEETNSSVYLVTKSTEIFKNRNSNFYTLDVLNSEGKVEALDVTEKFVTDYNKDAKAGKKWADLVKEGNIIEIELDKNGKVDDVVALDKVGVYTDKFKVTAEYAKGWKLQPSTVVFRQDTQTNLEKLSVLTLEKAAEKFSNIEEYILYVGSNGRVVAIHAIKTDAKTDLTYKVGLVTANPKYLTGSAKKADVTIAIKGEKETFTTTQKLVDENKIAKGQIVKIGVGNKTGEIESFDVLKGKSVTVSSIDVGRKYINTATDTYELIDGAVIYDKDLDVVYLRELQKGDKIVVYLKEGATRFVEYATLGAKDSTPEAGDKLETAWNLRGNLWVTIGKDDYIYGGTMTLQQLLALKGKVVEFKTAKVDGEIVITELKEKVEEPVDPVDPVDPEPKEIKAEATKKVVMGITDFSISVDGAELTDVTDVLINGEKASNPEIKGEVIRVRTGSTVNTLEIVIDGKTYPVTIK